MRAVIGMRMVPRTSGVGAFLESEMNIARTALATTGKAITTTLHTHAAALMFASTRVGARRTPRESASTMSVVIGPGLGAFLQSGMTNAGTTTTKTTATATTTTVAEFHARVGGASGGAELLFFARLLRITRAKCDRRAA